MRSIVRRVVDGDTIILDVYIGVEVIAPHQPIDTDLGMGLSMDENGMLVLRKVRARLYKFYAPEIDTPEGVIAKDMLVAALPIGTELTIKVHGRDKYGRWLIDPILNGINVCSLLSPG